jgi:dihydrofolate reductase
MIISAIVATAHNQVIGKDNSLPWYLPADLKYFKKTTLGHHILMGRKNYESIGRPLPKRTNIIITRNPYYISSGCLTAHSIEDALQIAYENGEDEVFIIGGGEIYQASMPYLERIYLTEVDVDIEGDVFFPEIDSTQWKEISSDPHLAGGKNPMNYCFKVFERIDRMSK